MISIETKKREILAACQALHRENKAKNEARKQAHARRIKLVEFINALDTALYMQRVNALSYEVVMEAMNENI